MCLFHNSWRTFVDTVTNSTNLIFSNFQVSRGSWSCNTAPINFFCSISVVNRFKKTEKCSENSVLWTLIAPAIMDAYRQCLLMLLLNSKYLEFVCYREHTGKIKINISLPHITLIELLSPFSATYQPLFFFMSKKVRCVQKYFLKIRRSTF